MSTLATIVLHDGTWGEESGIGPGIGLARRGPGPSEVAPPCGKMSSSNPGKEESRNSHLKATWTNWPVMAFTKTPVIVGMIPEICVTHSYRSSRRAHLVSRRK